MKLIFVRHGKDDDRYRGGWSALDLTPEGRCQAERLAKHIRENNRYYRIACIVSSDLPRAMTTANCIAAELGLPIQKDRRLREIDNGDLAGMLNETALEKYPGLFFNALEMDEHYPNGESPRDFFRRIELWLSEFAANRPAENVLVLTHGGVINVVYHLVKGMEWSNKNPPFPAASCGIHVLNLDTMEFEIQNKTDL